MNSEPSIYDSAVRSLMWLMRAQLDCERINDFGEVTGIRDEIEQLNKDARNAFASIERRSWYLVNKADKFHEPTSEGENK